MQGPMNVKFITNVVSTDTILVSWQSTVYELPEDGLNKGPKHVGASFKCFNVNFSAFFLKCKYCVHLLVY